MLHYFQELFETESAVGVQLCIGNEVMSFVRISTKTLYNCLQVIDINEACLLSIKHVKYAAEVFNLLLRVLLKYIIAFLLLVDVYSTHTNSYETELQMRIIGKMTSINLSREWYTKTTVMRISLTTPL